MSEKFEPVIPPAEESKQEEEIKAAKDDLAFSESKYNFPELFEHIKESMTIIVTELKEAIEKGEYQTLISDEVGGRIPTLILSKIMRIKGPQDAEVKVVFPALGLGTKQWDSSLDDYIKKEKENWGKSLFVTEFISTHALTISKIFRMFDIENNYTNYDIASLSIQSRSIRIPNPNVHNGYDYKYASELPSNERAAAVKNHIAHLIIERRKNSYNVEGEKYEHKIFSGDWVNKLHLGDGSSSKVSGVKRRLIKEEYSDVWYDGQPEGFVVGAFPERTEKILANPEPSEHEIFGTLGIEAGQYSPDLEDKEKIQAIREKIKKVEMSSEKIREIQETTNKAREDVNTVANEILAEIWPENT